MNTYFNTILCSEIIILIICLLSLLQGKCMIYCQNSLFVWPAISTEKNKQFELFPPHANILQPAVY